MAYSERAKEDVAQNSVIMHEINKGCCDEWPYVTCFGSLIFLLELIDAYSLLILTSNDT